MTVPEKLLWSRLCGRQVAGLKFRRDYKAGPHVVTFYAADLSLAIDLVGSEIEPGSKTEKQDAFFEKKGITLLRLTNDDVTDRMDEVMQRIEAIANEKS